MRATLGPAAALACLVALAPLGGAPTAAAGPDGRAAAARPHILEFEYYEDLEDGRRHNVSATIRGKAEKLTARLGDLRASARVSGQIGTGGRDKHVWFFRERKFVRAIRAELENDGSLKVAVRATAAGDYVNRKRCTLEFEPDPTYGDYAGGECRKRD